MGNPKSRGNYPSAGCMKFECKNRDKKCDDCLRFSHLETKDKK